MNRKGQALIEFVLIMPVLLFILLIIFDFGMILSNKTNLSPAEVLIGPYLGIDDYLKGGKRNPDSVIENIQIVFGTLLEDGTYYYIATVVANDFIDISGKVEESFCKWLDTLIPFDISDYKILKIKYTSANKYECLTNDDIFSDISY